MHEMYVIWSKRDGKRVMPNV